MVVERDRHKAVADLLADQRTLKLKSPLNYYSLSKTHHYFVASQLHWPAISHVLLLAVEAKLA